MTLAFRAANRSEAKPLVGLYALSGTGKTYSALLLARGFVGPKGRIGMIESEGGRGEAYADMIEGGYQVLPLREDFSSKAYGAAITAAENAKLDALIIDSASHEWEGIGGVLDQAERNQSGGAKGVLVWQRPKMDHAKHFMLRLMQTPIPLVIVCMRAKYPMIERRKADGSKEWIRSDTLEPKQADDILSELFVHGWIDEGHNLHVTKYTRPDLADVFLEGEPITLDTGRRLAAWAKGEKLPAPPLAGLALDADRALAAAANDGTDALRAQWRALSSAMQLRLKPRLDAVHKRVAAAADEKTGADFPPALEDADASRPAERGASAPQAASPSPPSSREVAADERSDPAGAVSPAGQGAAPWPDDQVPKTERDYQRYAMTRIVRAGDGEILLAWLGSAEQKSLRNRCHVSQEVREQLVAAAREQAAALKAAKQKGR
jgi:hypothetical protein